MELFNQIIEKAGGQVQSSLTDNPVNTETPKVETPETPKVETPEVKAETPVVETPKTETPVVETPKVETPKSETPVVEKVEVPATPQEKKSYKGSEIFQNINKEFQEEHGLSLIQAQEILSVNYDEIEDERDIMRDYLDASEDGITDKEINIRIKKYDLLFKTDAELDSMIKDGTLTQDQFDELEAEWLGKLRPAKNYLKDLQSKVREKVDNFEVEPNIENNNGGKADEVSKKLAEMSNQFLPNYANETIKIVDAEGKELDTVNFVTDEAGKKLVADVISDPSNIYKRWMDGEGKINVQKMVKDIYTLENKAKMDKAIYDQGLAKGAMNIVKDQSNIDFSQNKQPLPGDSNVSEGLRVAFEKINNYVR